MAITAGAVTLVTWHLLGADIDFSIIRMVTVLVIACPHALGLAVPLVVVISTTLGAQGGLLVRDRRGLAEARNLDTVIFDKTGTLTLGEFRVVEIAVAEGSSEEDALTVAAGMESDSERPIARGVVETARDREISIPSAGGFQAITGKGVAASVDGTRYQMGGPALPEAKDVHVSTRIREAIRALQEQGLEGAMLTGDAQAVADAVAKERGIDTVFAEVLLEDKASKVEELQRQGKRVAMVGDGVNDALATADIGIAIGAGTDVAVKAGHIVLVRSDPRDLVRILTLSRATYRKMLQNLWWAAGYNIVAIPLAAGVLAGWDILLTPAVAAVLMSASTVIVALNAQLPRRVEL